MRSFSNQFHEEPIRGKKKKNCPISTLFGRLWECFWESKQGIQGLGSYFTSKRYSRVFHFLSFIFVVFELGLL